MNRNRKKQKPVSLPDEAEDGASPKKRNPIIFARTETVHMPKSLQKNERHKKLANAVYSVHNDGSLKPTPVEEPEETEKESKKRHCGFWRRLCCCMGRREPIPTDDLSTNCLIEAVSREEVVPFLGEQRPCDKGKKTLILDLDETLVHSSFQPTTDCQYVIPVTIEGNVYKVYVYRRPGACEFIEHMSQFYEIVVYTASLKIVPFSTPSHLSYADPLLDQMDPKGLIAYRLFRDHCVVSDGVFVKDLGLLGRDLRSVVIIDNAAVSFKFQPRNGIECTPFIDNMKDDELSEMTPFLEYLSKKSDVRQFVKMWKDTHEAQSQLVVYSR